MIVRKPLHWGFVFSGEVMVPIKVTPLFKSVSKKISSITPEELAIELDRVREHFSQPNLFPKGVGSYFSDWSDNLDAAFIWDDTPQGSDYWYPLYSETTEF